MQHLITYGVVSVDCHTWGDQKSRGIFFEFGMKKAEANKISLGTSMCMEACNAFGIFLEYRKKGSKLQVWTVFEVVRVHTSRIFESRMENCMFKLHFKQNHNVHNAEAVTFCLISCDIGNGLRAQSYRHWKFTNYQLKWHIKRSWILHLLWIWRCQVHDHMSA